MTGPVEFFAPGRPATKGSTRSFRAKSGAIVTKTDNERGPAWQGVVACAAAQSGAQITEHPVKVTLLFRFSRPKSHYGTGKNADKLKPSAPPSHAATAHNLGDVDKLERACLDALTGVAWRDDKQVVRVEKAKEWCARGEPEGALVRVEVLGG